MLYYLPLEGYKERYTMQWSAPIKGWLERNWIKYGVEYTRIDPAMFFDNAYGKGRDTIKVGSVVDGVGRAMYTFRQIETLLNMAEQGKVKDTDVIFLDDFWTPGLEALPYAFHLLGIRPRVYAFLHAQSVDEFDFTHPMRNWMRPIERGFGEWLDGIFVCCPTLKDLVCFGGIAERSKVHVTGHPFNSEEVMERMPSWYRNDVGDKELALIGKQNFKPSQRKNQVVWSSRFDAEKNPMFFLTVVEQMIRDKANVKFVVCTSAPKLRSNYPAALARLTVLTKAYPNHVEVKENLSKEDYYATLCESKVQFNSASQDFVAITLLESSVAGCWPVYPYFRSFPETFLYQSEYMYQHLNVQSAVNSLNAVLTRDDLWSNEAIKKREWVHRRFDTSWIRMADKMGVNLAHNKLTEGQFREFHFDPFCSPTVWGV